MKNFIKYEIRGTYKFMLSVIAVVLLISTMLQLKVSSITNIMLSDGTYGTFYLDDMDLTIIIMVLGVMLAIGLLIASTIYIINSYKKELETNRGYLTFTLPMTGNQILGSKLLVALFWHIVIGSLFIIFNLVLATMVFGASLSELIQLLKEINVNTTLVSITFLISNLISISLTMILVYFSITISRVTFKNKMLGGVWFALFIALNFLFSFAIVKLSSVIPYYINLSNFSISNINNLGFIIPQDIPTYITLNVPDTLIFLGTNNQPYSNIVGLISHIVVVVGGFFTTGYLLEKKINL